MKIIQQMLRPLSVFLFFPIFVACDMTKELDIDILSLPPKLSVTAILNGGSGVFEIRLMGITSISETYWLNKDNVRNGEIRLYEDGKLIFTLPGPFDMSREITSHGYRWKWGKNGYYYVTGGMDTRAGSDYRLEVDVEGYPLAVSSSVMPTAPVVSAIMDTSVQMIKKNVVEIGAAGYWLSNLGTDWYGKYPDKYWPFSVSVDDAGADNYFALDILNYRRNDNMNRGTFWGIGGSDATILLELGMDSELLGSKQADLYLFPMLMTNNFKGGTRNFFAASVEILNHQEFDDSSLVDHPDMEKITTQHSLILRVRSISPAIYRYYRSLSSQLTDDMFTEQPTVVVGNIENGYGSFAVYNTANITLLEWETYEYR